MALPEPLRRFGRDMAGRLTGHGEQVDFRQQAREYAIRHGVSQELGEKAVLQDRLETLDTELDRRRQLSLDVFRSVEVALAEMFSCAELEGLRADGDDPSVFRPLLWPPPVHPGDTRRVERFFRGEHRNSRPPSAAVLHDACEQLASISMLMDRLLPDLEADPNDLPTQIGSDPEIGADIGRMLSHIDQFREHFAGHRRRIESDAALHDARDAVGRVLLEPVRWFIDTNRDLFRMIQTGNPMHFFRAGLRTVRAVGRIIGGSASIVVGLTSALRRRTSS